MSNETATLSTNARSSDYLVGKNKNETRLVPYAFIPQNILLTHSQNSVIFTFEYNISESSVEEQLAEFPNLYFKVGRYTKKLQQITILNIKSDNADEILQNINSSLGLLLKKSHLDSIQKSYTFIIKFFASANSEIKDILLSRF